MKKMKLVVVKGVKFSFEIPKKFAAKVLSLAIENDLEMKYKVLAGEHPLTKFNGIGSLVDTIFFIEEIEKEFNGEIDLLDFIQSFKYKEIDFTQPLPIPFVEKVTKKSNSNTKK